jgi:uncharacterized membrane protein
MTFEIFDLIVKVLILIVITLIPFFELRASIPLGILSSGVTLAGVHFQAFNLPWITVFLICVITNIFLGPIIYIFLNKTFHYLEKFTLFRKYYERKVEKVQKKIHRSVKKYGVFGIALFIAVPLPGSGSYSGALISYILGLKYKDFIVANTVGVIIAGAIVTLITLTGVSLFNLLF